MRPILRQPDPNPLPRLATPGERLGWIFNDRNLYRRKFMDPPPQPDMVPKELVERLDKARSQRGRRVALSLGIGVGLAALIGCCGGILTAWLSDAPDGPPYGLVAFLAVVALLAGIGSAVYAAWLPGQARKALAEAQARARQDYERDHAAWDARREWHDQAQQQAVDAMAEWAAASPSPGTRRVDIIGGTSYGWEAVLTVFGGSLLASRGPMTLVDFTGEGLGDELIELASTTGRSVSELDLGRFDLVAGLEPDELVDALVEAMHGDAPEATRAERSQDAMLLRDISAVIAPDLSIARLIAALRVLTGDTDQPALSDAECERLIRLHQDEARRVRRIEAFLHPLSDTDAVAPAAADLTCLVASGEGGVAQRELVKDLTMQWLAHQVRHTEASAGSLLVLGADDVHHRAIERLSNLCERRGIRLVLFFEHLREESLRTIGGGEVALMRLGNHQEATQAAEFIGRGHKFVLSGITRTLGGEDTHTLADTYGESETRGGSNETIRTGRHISRRRGTNWSRTRNWSQTESVAQGTNWSDASAAARVYEYAVEPRVLQDLPEYAMILVKGQGRGSVVQAVEVDPAIVTLPRVSMDPMEPQPLPDPAEAVIPATRQPSQVTVSQPQPLTATDSSPTWSAQDRPNSHENHPTGHPKVD
ncbi:hypothetical protein HH310_22130 [Actinoplanes sp. TBRC 11911]|uniref:hypothetical protein n=1 Tax=Actinoplanes sp. TBRC 11911 TaxID=2729386 RepID=UPI00145C3B75|nr:hypothetical protein [Actinoplanes sp. TBRC 11911]NMO53868.1 hypothetical protein [Actinoplanes sp. TBRC 11911]